MYTLRFFSFIEWLSDKSLNSVGQQSQDITAASCILGTYNFTFSKQEKIIYLMEICVLYLSQLSILR